MGILTRTTAFALGGICLLLLVVAGAFVWLADAANEAGDSLRQRRK